MTMVEFKHPTNIAAAVQQLIDSPRLPVYVAQFQALIEAERKKRERFYKEMSEDQKVEFIQGQIIVHSPVQFKHSLASQNLFTWLNIFVRKHKLGFVGHEKILVALTRNDYGPDVCYFGPDKAQAFAPDQVRFPAPDWVIEVLSPSTEAYDRGVKFQDYAAHGVAEYWIVDPEQRIVEQYILAEGVYQLRIKTDTGTLRSVALEGFTISVQAIFDESGEFAATSQLRPER